MASTICDCSDPPDTRKFHLPAPKDLIVVSAKAQLQGILFVLPATVLPPFRPLTLPRMDT